MASIREVARQANVSPGTVSQLLNGRRSVRPATARRIEAAIQALGYERKPGGRPRTRHTTYHFAYLIGRLKDSHAQVDRLARRRLISIRQLLARTGDQLSIYPGNYPLHENWAFHDAIESAQVQGVICTSFDFPQQDLWHEYFDWLRARGVPNVMIDRASPDHLWSAVGVDSRLGGRLAAEHLIELGHRRIGFLTRTIHRHIAFVQREAGFYEAVKNAPDVQADDRWVLDPGISTKQLDNLCRGIIDAGVTGILVPGDPQALMVINAFERLGIRIPDECSVIGFDDIGERSHGGLQPTTIGYDEHCLVDQVRQTLCRLVERPEVSHTCLLVKPYVVPCDTTAPPPAVAGNGQHF